jgi:hypothetical protein
MCMFRVSYAAHLRIDNDVKVFSLGLRSQADWNEHDMVEPSMVSNVYIAFLYTLIIYRFSRCTHYTFEEFVNPHLH